jgi:hypothetical protein
MSSQVRRADTTRGPPLRILSIDGGGVRGYSVLILLQELMHQTYVEIHGEAPAKDQIPKPCDHFDLIGGTGTGGLIAVMLGRLRMDLETCKEVYVKVTKHVFETDKTFAGIPYTSTLYKASKLEEAIKDCVRGHTISEHEGNDSFKSVSSKAGSSLDLPQGNSIGSSRPSSSSNGGRDVRGYASKFGHPDAEFYDRRENRTKTAVTAVYKGTPLSGSSVLLRSYDSRKEPAPEVHCTIWQAGRATCATQLAFKPIQIGQSIFVDEGAGKYNPTPQLVDEAVLNEWPGREVGVIVTIGSGKRPGGPNAEQHDWWEGFMVGGFADARKRLIAKIEGCEDIHQYMLHERLNQRNINPENYFRLNVEVGVGEFGMNEWNRISDISTNTSRYLSKPDVKNINHNAASRLARIHRAKERWERTGSEGAARIRPHSFEAHHNGYDEPQEYVPPSNPVAVELPAEPTDIPQLDSRPSQRQPALPPRLQQYQQYPSADDKFAVLDEPQRPSYSPTSSHAPYSPISQISSYAASPQQGRPSFDSYNYNRPDQADVPAPLHPRHRVSSGSGSSSGPPIPPKTPISQVDGASYGLPIRPPRESPRAPLPYPDTDGPPPAVNIANKPQFRM